MNYIKIIVAGIVLGGCSSSPELVSRWQGAESRGADSSAYIKDQNISLKIQNDNEYLSLTVAMGGQAIQRQIYFQGLTVWFDYRGGEERRFGIRYPLRPERSVSEPGRVEHMLDTTWSPVSSDEIEIFGPLEGEHRMMHMIESRGIDVRIEYRKETVVYRLRVPLMDNGPHLYGIGARAGETIGFGLETSSQVRRGEPGGFGGGGGGGRRGGGRGGYGRREFPGRENTGGEGIKFWAKVRLAQGAHAGEGSP